MSLSEGETSYICIHGANISVLLTSSTIAPDFTFGVWSDLWTLFLSKCQEFPTTPTWATVLLCYWTILRKKTNHYESNWASAMKKMPKISKSFQTKWTLCVNLSPRTTRTARKRNQRKVTQRSMCLQAVRNQWHILYIYVKIFLFTIFVFFRSYPVYINL